MEKQIDSLTSLQITTPSRYKGCSKNRLNTIKWTEHNHMGLGRMVHLSHAPKLYFKFFRRKSARGIGVNMVLFILMLFVINKSEHCSNSCN